MTVLFLSPSASLGGAERVLLTMVGALRAQLPDLGLHVVTLDDGPLTGLLAGEGVRVSCLPLTSRLAELGDSQLGLHGGAGKLSLCCRGTAVLPELCCYLRRLRTMVRQLRPTLIHSNGIKTHLLARLAQLGEFPLLWHVHDFYGARPLARRLLAWSARRLRTAVAISEAVAADFRAVVSGTPVAVIPNAIDVGRFRPHEVDAGRLDALAGLSPPPARTLRVGLVATYARWKGHDVFLNAAAKVARAALAVPVRFYIVGGPVYRTHGSQTRDVELRERIAALGLTHCVGLVGFQHDPSEVYPALDVVVHASTRPEPFGLTIIEAMASGCAVVASTAGGAAELFRHGQDALGVPPGDVPALAHQLVTLLGDADLRRRLGRGARATATRRFDQSRIGGQLVDVYRGVLTRRPGSGWVSPADLRPLFPSPSPTRQLKL